MNIRYEVNVPLDPQAVASLFRVSGIDRPHDDLRRIERMILGADLTVTAWNGSQLVGFARALTDWCYCCYLSDLAVARDYQRNAIGTGLLKLVEDEIGDSVTLVLISAPDAKEFYRRLGLASTDLAFIVRRKR